VGAFVGDDPDADVGVVTHWVVYGIPPDVTELPEGLPADAIIDEPVSLLQGLNEFDQLGYTGPSADEDRGPHRIFFRLFALDTELDLPPGVRRQELRQAAKDHVIANAELVGIA
jgi:Raf kinase inhibitor-like YbhB/YbcL family protein